MAGLEIEDQPLPAKRSFKSAPQPKHATGDYGAEAKEQWA